MRYICRLTKSLGTVGHKILLSKLDIYIIRGISNNWFKPDRSNNKHLFVFVNGYDSGLAEMNCGVSQAFILGPLPFLLYINDLNQAIKFCKVHYFADHTSLLYLDKSIKKLNKPVDFDLKYLVYWLNA